MSASLRDQLNTLHRQLADLGSVDAQTAASLQLLQADIARLTGSSTTYPGEDSAADRLEALAVRFESEHPAIAAALRRAIDLLAKAGI